MGFGIGQPSESELRCLARIRLWESLIPFVEMVLEENPFPKRRPKHEYDWRVVVANAKGA